MFPFKTINIGRQKNGPEVVLYIRGKCGQEKEKKNCRGQGQQQLLTEWIQYQCILNDL